jgi:methyl-accepting chemotaxis protein
MRTSRLFKKILTIVVLLFGITAITTAVFSGWNLQKHLMEEYKSKGTAIANSIASSSVEILLNRDASTLQAVIDQFMEIQGVSYVYIVDEQGEIITHTFVPSIPEEVFTVKGEKDKTTIKELHIKGMGDFTHISSPILAGVAGYVHVGMDKGIILAQMKSTMVSQFYLIAIIFLISVIGAYLLANKVSRPLSKLSVYARELIPIESTQRGDEIAILTTSMKALMDYLQEMAAVANRISQGDLSLHIEPKSRQDILGHAFAQMTRYIREMAEVANKLAGGDLTPDIHPRSEKDVLGVAFRNMITQLRALVSQIRGQANQIAQISVEILTRSDEDLKTVENVTSSAEETSSAMSEMGASVEEVAGNTQTLFMSTEEISSSIEQMFNSIRQVTESSRRLSELSEMTAAAMNQMVFSIETIAKNAENSRQFYHETTDITLQGQTSMQQVVRSMDKIREAVSSATYTIQNLENRSQEIGSILDVIDNIADQTALLALNASILAAQAGEHGRGFAVVADEIKDLANRVALSTQEITQIIEAVQRQSANAVNVIQEGNKEVDEGVKRVNLASQALDRITASAQNSLSAATEIVQAIQEQKASTQKIMESVKKVTEQITEINEATQEQEKGSSQILHAIGEVRGLAEQVKRATLEQSKGANQVSLAMEEVKSLISQSSSNARQSAQAAAELSAQAETLRKLMDRFKLMGN